MRIVFCGTPQFAVPTLTALLDAGDFDVCLVVCQPDRPAGRGLSLTAPPVKQLAVAHGLPVAQPENIKNNAEFRAQLEAVRPDAIVVVAYGRIIPQSMIELPPLGNINLHASLLPKYRGAAPIQWAIAKGETISGVTTIRIDAGLDSGDILCVRELPIAPEDTAETLAPKLASIGAPLVVETLRGLKSGSITPLVQNSSAATLAPLLTREDGLIRFERTATEIWNRLRGFSPWPGAYTTFRGKTLNVWSALPVSTGSEPLAPGQLQAHGEHLYVGCGQNTKLELFEVQPQGKRRMTARDFINGYRVKQGEFVIW
jgi:methionyl-tRNA formyltransferase